MTTWPHSPAHLFQEQGVFMITAGTYLKEHFFKTDEKLDLLQTHLLVLAKAFNWELHAWAIFSNHYHFVGKSPKDPLNIKAFITALHRETAIAVNKLDSTPDRTVWYQYWDTRLTIHTSYLARLNYVHQNPVKHGIVSNAVDYKWCSASEFEKNGKPSFVKSIYSFDYEKVKIDDNF